MFDLYLLRKEECITSDYYENEIREVMKEIPGLELVTMSIEEAIGDERLKSDITLSMVPTLYLLKDDKIVFYKHGYFPRKLLKTQLLFEME